MDKLNRSLKDIQTKAKRLWDENPVLTIALGVATANAAAKLVQANSARRNSKAWSREVKRREKNDKHK
jgi:hypothetical protein